MNDNSIDRQALERALENLYGDIGMADKQFETLMDRSLAPRGPDMLYERMGALGLSEGDLLLDAGCRDAAHTCELARRYGCRALGVDPIAYNIAKARDLIARAGLQDRVRAAEGRIEALPAADGEVDYIWCRDVLSHVPDLRAALAECARVLRPGGAMLIYLTCATELLEPREAERLFGPLAVVWSSASAAALEAACHDAGLRVVERDEIGSEWRERWEEDGVRTTSSQLLRIARMRRDRDRLIAEMGPDVYAGELANCHWGVYQMLGKLCPTMYVLERPA